MNATANQRHTQLIKEQAAALGFTFLRRGPG